MVGSAESSSRPASRGPPPDWSCRQFPPGAHSPASPSCCLSSPHYLFLSFWGGLSPGQQPASPPACGSLTSPAGKGSLGGVLAMAGIESAAPRPGRSHVHTATPAGRCGQSARPRCLRCNKRSFVVRLQLERSETPGSCSSWTMFFLTPCARTFKCTRGSAPSLLNPPKWTRTHSPTHFSDIDK